jgi:hypothetical protein
MVAKKSQVSSTVSLGTGRIFRAYIPQHSEWIYTLDDIKTGYCGSSSFIGKARGQYSE